MAEKPLDFTGMPIGTLMRFETGKVAYFAGTTWDPRYVRVRFGRNTKRIRPTVVAVGQLREYRRRKG